MSKGEVRDIIEVLRTAWGRLTRKQYLFLYPLLLSVMNAAAFLAIFIAVEGRFSWSDYARANFAPWSYIQQHFDTIARPGITLIVALAAGLGVCLLAAAIRAPYFRAIVGPGYPRAPRSPAELARLAIYYMATYLIFYVLPFAFPADSTAFAALLYGTMPVAILLIFGDYACVFEESSPLRAARSSVRLLGKGWAAAILVYVAATVFWLLAGSLYGGYYESEGPVFVLLPLSQFLVQALITLLLDTLLISLYEHYRRR